MTDGVEFFRRTTKGEIARVGQYASGKTLGKLIDAGNLRQIINDSERVVSFAGDRMMQELMSRAAVVIGGEVGGAVGVFAESLQYAVNRRVGLKAAHQRIANAAQTATVAAYEDKVTGTGVRSYRNDGTGRLPGRMSAALNDKSFVVASTTGVFFGNRAMLDEVAPHWFRLNYGAQGSRANQTQPQPKRLRLFGSHVATLKLSSGHGKRIVVPYGVWIENGQPVHWNTQKGRTVGQFYTLASLGNRAHETNDRKPRPGVRKFAEFGGEGKTPNYKSSKSTRPDGYMLGKPAPSIHDFFDGPKLSAKGSAGHQFFDAGVAALKNTMQVEYKAIMTKWFEDASNAGGRGGPIRKIGVSPTGASQHLKVIRGR